MLGNTLRDEIFLHTKLNTVQWTENNHQPNVLMRIKIRRRLNILIHNTLASLHNMLIYASQIDIQAYIDNLLNSMIQRYIATIWLYNTIPAHLCLTTMHMPV